MSLLLDSVRLRLGHLVEWFDGDGTPESASATEAPSGIAEGSTVLGRYQVTGVLGQGGMGKVWSASDLQERRRVAIKEMRAPRGEGGAAFDVAFKQEFYTMTKLQHPNTVKVFDYGVLDGGDRFIVMEAVKGQDLADLVKRGPLPLRQVYRVLVDLANVLGFIHSRLFVHCDLKSGNVRLTEKGAVKLMDFGLMHQLGTPVGGVLKGTPQYMAPEIPRGGVVDARTDLYSLGVLAFELATGRFPFAGKKLTELLDQHMNRPPPRLSLFREVPESFERLVTKLLAKQPAERYQNAAELLGALAELTGGAAAAPDYGARASYLQAPDLVGRDAEHAALRGALHATLEGKGRSVLVAAPAGIGKTRLLQEFRLAVKLADLPFVTGQCRAEGQAPLAALSEALVQLASFCPRETLERHGPLLARLVPGLVQLGLAPAEVAEKSAEKALVFEALRGFLRETAERRPFVLCLEDLHWADFSTLEFLNVAIRELAAKKALVLGTFRSDEVDRLSILFQTVDEGVTERLDLRPLSAGDTQALVATMLRGAELPAAFLERLVATTAGNAFFVTETLRTLVEEQALRLKHGRWILEEGGPALPSSIGEAVARRLASLPPEALDLCRAVAPMGRVLDLHVVKRLAGLPDEQLFDRLGELVERQFLQRVSADYYFSHDTVRQGVYATTPEADRRSAHQRIAEALEQVHAGALEEQSALLGYHYARGADAGKAIHFLRVAGDRAVARSLLLEGNRLLAESAELLEASPGAEKEVRLVEQWAKLVDLGFVAHPPTCAKYGEKLFAAFQKRVDLEAGTRAFHAETRRLVEHPGLLGRKKLERLWGEQPLQPASTDPMHVIPKATTYRCLQAFAHGVLGQAPQAMKILDQLAALNPDPSAFRAAAQIARNVGLWHMGMWAAQQSQAREARGWFEEHLRAVGTMPVKLFWYYTSCFYWEAVGQAGMGRALDAALVERGLELAGRFSFSDWKFLLSNARLVRAAVVGRPEEMQPIYGQLGDTIRRLGNPRLLEGRFWMFVPMYYVQRCERELGEAAVRKLEGVVALGNDAWLRRYALAYRALFEVEHGSRERALACVAAARAAAAEAPGFSRLPQLLCAQARLEAGGGQREAARALAEQALAAATGANAAPWAETVALRTLAELVPAPEGLPLAERAVDVASKHGLEIDRARGLLALGRVAAGADRTRAAAALSEAEALLEALACPDLLQRVAEARRRAANVA